MARQKWTPETPWVKSRKKTQAVWPTYVCRNPNCRSYGKSHPNCKCGAPSFSAQSRALEYAEGGEVHFCQAGNGHHAECEYFAEGGEIEANREFDLNPDLALDHAIYHHGLHHALTKTGHSRSEDPMRHADDFLDAARRGRKTVRSHGTEVYTAPLKTNPRPDAETALREHLQTWEENPESMLDIGGELGAQLPNHAGALAAKAAMLRTYFQSIKPKPQQNRPLDPVMQAPRGQEMGYKRQLSIAESPGDALALLQEGRLQPADLRTLEAIYPKLTASMRNHVGEALIDAQSNQKLIPYRQKLKTSLLLGQPLDSTMTQATMMACIQANADAETTTQGDQNQGQDMKTHQPSSATQRTIQKTDRLYETPLEEAAVNRKS